MGVPVSTYTQHESNERGIPASRARQYCEFFRVAPEWLLYGIEATPPGPVPAVPLVGVVGAGSQVAYFLPSGGRGRVAEVDPPPPATSAMRAIEIKTEDGFGPVFDRWLAFYNDEHTPVHAQHIGQLCLCGLPDGRTLVRKLQKSKAEGLYHLTSGAAEPLLDQRVIWATRIVCLIPR